MRCLAAVILLAACSDPAPGPGGFSRTAIQDLAVPAAADLDILIVVEDSPAMAAHHDEVHAAAAELVATLNALPGGLPDLHLGVITTDVGTSPGDGGAAPEVIGTLGQGGCASAGKGGKLQVSGAPLTGNFLSDIRLGDNTRQLNYTGELGAVVDKLVDVGAGGCAYPRPLEAIKRALADGNPTNAGFHRPDAWLAVIVLAASDDCSFGPAAFLDGATTDDTSRCTTGALAPVADYATALEAHVTDPSRLVVLGVLGDMPVRLHDFLGNFPNRSSETTLTGLPSNAYDLLTTFHRELLGIPCWEVPLLDVDTVAPGLQTACTAELDLPDPLVVGRCTDTTTTPCYSIIEDARTCPDSGAYTKLQHFEAYDGGRVRLECLVADTP